MLLRALFGGKYEMNVVFYGKKLQLAFSFIATFELIFTNKVKNKKSSRTVIIMDILRSSEQRPEQLKIVSFTFCTMPCSWMAV
jgi:hypothetical protein